MRTSILADAVIATSMALLLVMTGISIALAKDLQSQTERGAANVSNSPLSEREINATGGKEDTSSASTSDKVLYGYKYKKKADGWDKDRKYEVTPGEGGGSNPQPWPPKKIKEPPVDAVDLIRPPKPPQGM